MIYSSHHLIFNHLFIINSRIIAHTAAYRQFSTRTGPAKLLKDLAMTLPATPFADFAPRTPLNNPLRADGGVDAARIRVDICAQRQRGCQSRWRRVLPGHKL